MRDHLSNVYQTIREKVFIISIFRSPLEICSITSIGRITVGWTVNFSIYYIGSPSLCKIVTNQTTYGNTSRTQTIYDCPLLCIAASPGWLVYVPACRLVSILVVIESLFCRQYYSNLTAIETFVCSMDGRVVLRQKIGSKHVPDESPLTTTIVPQSLPYASGGWKFEGWTGVTTLAWCCCHAGSITTTFSSWQ